MVEAMVPPRLEHLHVSLTAVTVRTHSLSYYGILELLETAYRSDPPVRITLDCSSMGSMYSVRTQYRGAPTQDV